MSKKQQLHWQQLDPQCQAEKDRYGSAIPSRIYIQQVLEESGKPLTSVQLGRAMAGLTEEEFGPFERRLHAMARDGELVQNRRGAWGLVSKMHLVTGTVQGHRDGFGFLIPDEGGKDVFLNPRQMKELLHGDRIVVRIAGVDRRGRPEGRLVDVLERPERRLAGRYFNESGVGFVIPEDSRIQHHIFIPKRGKKIADGTVVVVKITTAPSKQRSPAGEVVETLGTYAAPGMEIEIALRNAGIPHEWPADVEAQVRQFEEQSEPTSLKGRKDLRQLPLVTIDGADARDFDDAVCCEKTKSGWKLWVAIADVSSYVELGSALDGEALNRGTSVYFPGQVVPMLPEVLSNGLCSLNPEVNRNCMVCEMRVNAKGEVTRSWFYPALMRSHARLIYEDVAAALEGKQKLKASNGDDLLPQVQALHDLYQVMATARDERGAIDFESTETRIIFDDQRKIERIEPVHRNVAHRMIEECMIAANVEAAKFLLDNNMPGLYRVHDAPEGDKLEELAGFLSEIGIKLGTRQVKTDDFSALLKNAQARDDLRLIQTVVLRSMKQAIYSPNCSGHFGLALDQYAHFTSPIRRYPDLVVHRAIRQILNRKAPAAIDMESVARHCCLAERRADEATRDVSDWLKCEYIQDHVGEEYDGLVVSVTGFGLFVELDDLYVTGLVHVSNLPGDYYDFDASRHALVGQRSGRQFRLSDRVPVRVSRVDLEERKVDFELAGAGQDKARKKPEPSSGKGKKPVSKSPKKVSKKRTADKAKKKAKRRKNR